jgi:hypothetical protein
MSCEGSFLICVGTRWFFFIHIHIHVLFVTGGSGGVGVRASLVEGKEMSDNGAIGKQGMNG